MRVVGVVSHAGTHSPSDAGVHVFLEPVAAKRWSRRDGRESRSGRVALDGSAGSITGFEGAAKELRGPLRTRGTRKARCSKTSNYLALCVRGADDGNRTAQRWLRDLPEHENPQVVALLITPLPSVPPRCADPCAPSGCTTFAHTVHPRGCTMGQIEGHPVAASRRERRRKSPSACQIGKLRTPLRADLELHLPALILSVSRCPPGSLGWCTWCGTGLGLLVEMMTVLIVGVLYGVTQATQGNGHPGFRLKCPVALEAVAQDRCAPLAGDSRSEHVTSNFLSTGNHLSSWCVRMPCSATMGRTRSRAPVHSPSSGRRYGEIARDFALI